MRVGTPQTKELSGSGCQQLFYFRLLSSSPSFNWAVFYRIEKTAFEVVTKNPAHSSTTSDLLCQRVRNAEKKAMCLGPLASFPITHHVRFFMGGEGVSVWGTQSALS